LLEREGITIDSSVAEATYDYFKGAPNTPYYASRKDIRKKGNSNVLEIPVSSFFNFSFSDGCFSKNDSYWIEIVTRLFSMRYDVITSYIHSWESKAIKNLDEWLGWVYSEYDVTHLTQPELKSHLDKKIIRYNL